VPRNRLLTIAFALIVIETAAGPCKFPDRVIAMCKRFED
jgi:hypothetical protein